MGVPVSDILSSPWFLSWLVALFCGQGICMALFARLPMFKANPGTMAHQAVVIVPFVFLAASGSWLWFFSRDFADAFASDKLLGFYASAQSLMIVMFAFQIWDFTVTLAVKELREIQHLAHHSITCILACCGLLSGENGCLLYYAAFFFGVTEVSSIPLAMVDMFRKNQQLASAYPKTNELCRSVFAVLFLAIRCVYWPVVIVNLFIQLWQQRDRVGLPLVVFLYISGTGLTCLQYFWGSLVLRGVIKKFKGGDTSDVRTVVDHPAQCGDGRVALVSP
eukprot:TRINITY_DN11027_c0_g1_i1.p1 TRINITY_DN11027_c0_g1~~TRINITY_DN11027_c0_g1_i1.p1  ORF type:complete len:305 (-),score=25.72 TRINITY_DN11027_c0_g1_i1:313-1146(-)